MSMEETEFQYRRMLLDLYSTEINTHSRLFIGLSVTLFTLLELLRLDLVTLAETAIYIPICLVSASLWYLLFRHLTYGALANACIWTEPSCQEVITLREVNKSIVKYAERTTDLFRVRGRGIIPLATSHLRNAVGLCFP